mmetsp:Transcript_6690/g.17008  ORF Transcript_6690/g.17008 Transcript_6690/m.17008 type:complete len:551 (-) Transcript_6690:1213-2865(-)|eukprot:CAMPEP_0198239634 /NCGR_PEP_ID=MMETSP1446-20131203/4985_1 /TAXON_ID=1461542 ORGANISM="Unidentified sp, Strain CCMP2111" /NCGR_SAMPLE_ID=MMETSP1446 /ASSEMBLY_ACC=CAM_ASM_001112 /LENGTH=550 /DNA_ID=CAMNT_0043922261 /DNA_START=120 /DNA_END=1772 /DNA_ORIENTATION=-
MSARHPARRNATQLLDLPLGVLEKVFCHLNEWEDVVNFASCSRALRKVSEQAPVKIRISGFQKNRSPQEKVGENTEEVKRAINAKLELLERRFKGIVELELFECPIENIPLHNLKALSLLQCQRVGSGNISKFCRDAGKSVQAISLTKCFRLTWTAVQALLRHKSFFCISVSHVDLRNDACQSGFLRDLQGSCETQYLALNNCKLSLAVLFQILSLTPKLRVLSLGGSTFACDAGADSDGAAGPDLHLPSLEILEATFLPASAISAIRNCQPQVDVWDLCISADIAKAYRIYTGVDLAPRIGSNTGHTSGENHLSWSRMVLYSAVGCSSHARRQPLHHVVEHGGLADMKRLLEMGANLGARDSAGNTPLFIAAEQGRGAAAELFLAHGADITARNASGESPLYIASLIGHASVVEVVLSACRCRGLHWESPEFYGDGWTCLMASVVGGHSALTEMLLKQSGMEAAKLANAKNRYGQTALHIAARKGCLYLLTLLLSYGADTGIRDANKNTAYRIAKLNGHSDSMSALENAAKRKERRKGREEAAKTFVYD